MLGETLFLLLRRCSSMQKTGSSGSASASGGRAIAGRDRRMGRRDKQMGGEEGCHGGVLRMESARIGHDRRHRDGRDERRNWRRDGCSRRTPADGRRPEKKELVDVQKKET